MGTRLRWTAEGGTDGTNLTAGNSGGGSGPAATLVTPSNTPTMRFAAEAALTGALGLRIEAAASTTTYATWVFAAPAGRGSMRFLWRAPTALPGGDLVFAGLRGGADLADTSWMAQLVLKSSGAVHPRNSATTQLAALTGVTVTPGTVYWVELAATKGMSTSTGLIEARMWHFGAPPPAMQAWSGVNAGTVDASRVRIGVPQAGAAVMVQHVDDLAWEEGIPAGQGIGHWPSVLGQATCPLPALASQGAGSATPPGVSGPATNALPPLGQHATGQATIPGAAGAAASTLPPMGQAAAGTHEPPTVAGGAVSTLPALGQAGHGTTAPPPEITGDGASLLSPLASTATGTATRPYAPARRPRARILPTTTTATVHPNLARAEIT